MANNKVSISTPPDKLSKKLLKSENPDEIKDIIDIFNLSIQKKNVIRANRLSELQDKVTDQIGQRLSNNADNFSNKDLIDYMNAIQSILDKSTKSIEDVEVPMIAIQNNINVDPVAKFDRESRERIKDTLDSILASVPTTAEEIDESEEDSNV